MASATTHSNIPTTITLCWAHAHSRIASPHFATNLDEGVTMSTVFNHDHAHEHTQDNGTETGLNATLNEPISADGTPELDKTYTVPARCGRAVRVKAGQTIRIANPH